MIGSVSQTGPSVVVNGWVAIFFIVTGIIISLVAAWKVVWPALRAIVVIADQLPFLQHAEESHKTLEARVDKHANQIVNHETRITALEEQARR